MTIPQNFEEQWKPVPVCGYESAYSVSDHWRVRSERRLITHEGPFGVYTRPIRERVLRVKPNGYVSLYVGSVPKHVRVADMVLQAFGEAA